jgi:hypothetical protein
MADKQNIHNTDPLLLEFRNQYGKVARITIDDDTKIYLRGLSFGEWTDLNREVKVELLEDGTINYDFSDKGVHRYIIPCVLYPHELSDSILTKPVNINFITTTVLNITDFDKNEVLLSKYKRALGRQQLLASGIKRQLISTYGIQVLDYMKTASVDDIIELIAMGEWIKQDFGTFAQDLGYDNIVPINKLGKIDAKQMSALLQEWLFDEVAPQTGSPQNTTVSHLEISKPIPAHVPTPREAPTVNPVEVLTKDTDDSTPKENITISQVPQYIKKETEKQRVIKEPNLYNGDPSQMDPVLQERNAKEFGGQLINIWNESQIALYNEIMKDPDEVKTGDDLVNKDLEAWTQVGE